MSKKACLFIRPAGKFNFDTLGFHEYFIVFCSNLCKNYILYFQASDQEDDFITKVDSPKQLHIPPTESSTDTKDKAGGEKIKSIEKSKLLVQSLLSDGLCKASKLTENSVIYHIFCT